MKEKNNCLDYFINICLYSLHLKKKNKKTIDKNNSI